MRIFEELIGKHGLVNKAFTVVPNKPFLPKELISIYAESNNLSMIGCLSDKIVAGGTEFSYTDCVHSTFGEFAERYIGARAEYRNAIYGSYNDLTNQAIPCLHPTQIKIFADWQYESDKFYFKKFSVNHEVNWIAGKCFFTDKNIFIPEFLIGWCNNPKSKQQFTLQTTTGQASHTDFQKAVQHGFLEVLERHAYSHFWYYQNDLDFIIYNEQTILNAYSDDYRIRKLFKNNKVEIRVFDLGMLVPVESILVILFFEYGGKYLFSCGASARFNKKEAIIKACMEAYQTISYAIELDILSKWGTDYTKVLPLIANFEDHFHFFNAFPDLREQCNIFKSALTTTKGNRSIVNYDDKLDELNKDTVSKNELLKDFYYVDLTDNAAIGLPYYVVKVILPECAGITGNHRVPFLGSPIFNDKERLFLDLPHFFP